MKAYVLQNVGDIRLKEAEEPVPGDGEVVVKVRACGICGSDIPRIFQSGAHRMPLIPGHEFSGEVVGCGKGADARLLYKRVGVFPLIPCRECAACRKGIYELCRNYSYLGSRRNGGFAEYVCVPAENVMELPENVSFESAAMLEPMAVAVHAMRRALPCIEDNIVVWGVGTIGLLLVMFLMDAGFENIFVVGNKGFQKEAVLNMGISKDCFFYGGSLEGGCPGRRKADIIFECVGKNEVVSKSVELAAAEGKVCLVGNPYSDMTFSRDVYWKILRNQITITGTWNSSFTGRADDDWHYALKRISETNFAPERLISHRLSMEGLEKGFRLMRDKTEDYIKVMGVGGD